MTDRISAFIVTLDQDIREDDVEFILNAVRAIKHVQSVKPLVKSWENHVAQERVRQEIGEKLLKVIWPDWGKSEK